LIAPTGPARFAGALLARFDTRESAARARALAVAGGDGAAALDQLAVVLAGAGFGALAGLGLEDSGTAGGAPRTLAATLEGATRSHEAVLLVAHLRGAGNPDGPNNARGAAGQAGVALALAEALEAGELEVPARSLVFLWCEDAAASHAWLARGSHYVSAAVFSRLAPEPDAAATASMERDLDPGAAGGSMGTPERPRPDGLAVVARCALADVAGLVGGWRTSEAPFAGAGERRPFITVGVPTVLFRAAAEEGTAAAGDRGQDVTRENLRRTCVAAGATALALADPVPADLERYLLTNREELDLRVRDALEAEDGALAERWRDWCTGVRHWFRALCLDRPE
jgi:hypothetical protein